MRQSWPGNFPGNVAQTAAGLCGQPIGSVVTQIADLQTAFQTANAALNPGLSESRLSGPDVKQPGYAGAELPDAALGSDEHRFPETD